MVWSCGEACAGWGTWASSCAGLLGSGAAFLAGTFPAAVGAPLGLRTRVGLACAEQFPAFVLCRPGRAPPAAPAARLHLRPHGLNAAASLRKRPRPVAVRRVESSVRSRSRRRRVLTLPKGWPHSVTRVAGFPRAQTRSQGSNVGGLEGSSVLLARATTHHMLKLGPEAWCCSGTVDLNSVPPTPRCSCCWERGPDRK